VVKVRLIGVAAARGGRGAGGGEGVTCVSKDKTGAQECQEQDAQLAEAAAIEPSAKGRARTGASLLQALHAGVAGEALVGGVGGLGVARADVGKAGDQRVEGKRACTQRGSRSQTSPLPKSPPLVWER